MPLSSIAVAHWDLEEALSNAAAIDQIGAIDLTAAGTGGLPSVAGKVGNCRDFEVADSDNFSVANNATLKMANTYDWGFTGWFKLESKATTMHMISNRTAGLDYWVRYDLGADRFEFAVYTTAPAQSVVRADALGSPATATWYFIAAWYDHNAQTINIQVNDGTVNSAAHTGNFNNASSTFELGAGAGGELYDGLMDEITCFKNGFPSSTERSQIYNSGSGVTLAQLLAIGAAANDWTSPQRTPDRSPASTPQDRLRILRG